MTTLTEAPATAGVSYGEVVPAIRYLSRKEAAELIGLAPSTLSRYRLPEPDAVIGDVRGWLPETIKRWHASRPSQQQG